MSEEKKTQPVSEVYLRNYPKVIFFWPLFFTSLIAWLIQLFFAQPIAWLGNVWMIMFFVNLFISAFDFSSTKFFILILAIVVIGLLVVFLVVPNIDFATLPTVEINLGLSATFYLTMTIVLGFILGIIIISAYFDYYKVEQNEIYHKKGIFTSADRYPVERLRIKKSIPDVFEFFILRAGSLTLIPGRSDEVIHLPTVLNINKKEEQLDYLLSHVSVEGDQLDNQ